MTHISINVGGEIIQVGEETIRKCRVLAQYCGLGDFAAKPIPFFDDDPSAFRVILNFLRYDMLVHLDYLDQHTLTVASILASKYGLDDLADALKKVLKEFEPESSVSIVNDWGIDLKEWECTVVKRHDQESVDRKIAEG